MKRMSTIIIVLASLLCLSFIVGCGDDYGDSNSKVNVVMSDKVIVDTLNDYLEQITYTQENVPVQVQENTSLTMFDPHRVVVTFDDVLGEIPDYDLNTQHALTNFYNIAWGHDEIIGGTGFGVYRTVNASPMSGLNYTINRHGISILSVDFEETIHFKGASFAKASRHWAVPISDPESNTATMIRYHYYDGEDNQLGSSDWFDLEESPNFMRVNIFCDRVEIECTGDFPYDNVSWDIPEAYWYSMDDLTFIFKQSTEVTTNN